MLRAIHLNQLAAAVPPVPGLIRPWTAGIAILPETRLDHELA
jgi:hypothetical protein